jgi:hypothetical protein
MWSFLNTIEWLSIQDSARAYAYWLERHPGKSVDDYARDKDIERFWLSPFGQMTIYLIHISRYIKDCTFSTQRTLRFLNWYLLWIGKGLKEKFLTTFLGYSKYHLYDTSDPRIAPRYKKYPF